MHFQVFCLIQTYNPCQEFGSTYSLRRQAKRYSLFSAFCTVIFWYASKLFQLFSRQLRTVLIRRYWFCFEFLKHFFCSSVKGLLKSISLRIIIIHLQAVFIFKYTNCCFKVNPMFHNITLFFLFIPFKLQTCRLPDFIISYCAILFAI